MTDSWTDFFNSDDVTVTRTEYTVKVVLPRTRKRRSRQNIREFSTRIDLINCQHVDNFILKNITSIQSNQLSGFTIYLSPSTRCIHLYFIISITCHCIYVSTDSRVLTCCGQRTNEKFRPV